MPGINAFDYAKVLILLFLFNQKLLEAVYHSAFSNHSKLRV